MLHKTAKLLNILLVITLLPLGALTQLATTFAFAKDEDKGTGLFRTQITLHNPTDRTRLATYGVVVLQESADSALILATAAQLETLARLRFEPRASDELGQLVTNNQPTTPWLAPGLSSFMHQATSIQSQMESGEMEKEAGASSLNTLMDTLTVEQLAGLSTLLSVDDDGDGLTNTEEVWWCTNSLNPNTDGDAQGFTDGEEVSKLLDFTLPRNIRWGYGAPFGPPNVWPDWNGSDGNPNTTACNDGDWDTIPDYAEAYMVGTRVPSETTDGDKFDDGQELFGITYCPGGDANCGYGDYPRDVDSDYIPYEIPPWVKPPGDHPLVAAFPVPEVSVVPGSWTVEQITIITTEQGEMLQRTNSYETSVMRGQSSSIANSLTWNNWEETSKSIEQALEETVAGDMPSNNPVIAEMVAESVISMALSQEESDEVSFGQWLFDIAGGTVVENVMNDSYYEVKCERAGEGVRNWGDSCLPQQVYLANDINISDATITKLEKAFNTQGIIDSLDGINSSIDANGDLISRAIYDVSYQLSRPHSTETRGSGSSWGGVQTTTHETYEEHTITEAQAFTNGYNWSTAWTVDSSHVANLTFTYIIKNAGTEYAREIEDLVFNIYLGNDTEPITSYLAWQQFPDGRLSNLLPGASREFTSTPIALTLDQMRRIDLGERLSIVLENVAYGDDQAFHDAAVNGGVTVYIEDGVDDGDELVDYYVIPTWGSESIQDVLRRYFSSSADAEGNINSLWTPEFDGINPPVWFEHYLSDIAWWNIYLTQSNLGNLALHEIPAQAGEAILFRFNRDSDRDGYKDSVELHYYCTLPNMEDDYQYCGNAQLKPNIHPQPEILAGYTVTPSGDGGVGDIMTVLLKVANLGNFDAYGIDAVLYAPDDTITIGNNTVGGNGQVRPGKQVAIGSQILLPDLTNWGNSTAEPYPSGEYNGDIDNTLIFTVTEPGMVGQSVTEMIWSDSNGNTGTLSLGSAYHAPLPIDVIDGVHVGFNTGVLEAGATFTIDALTPRDTFTYTINSLPYTEPVIVLSYSDPQGSHRFATTVKLDSLNDDLTPHNGEMLKDMTLSIITSGEVAPDTINTTHFILNSPHPAPIENAHLYLNFISEGILQAEIPYTTTLQTGPTTFAVDWSTAIFSDTYDESADNILLAFWTDAQGNIIDSAARPFNTFQEDATTQVASAVQVWNIGTVTQGDLLNTQVPIANTGLASLFLGVDEGTEIATSSSMLVVRPGDFSNLELTLDTTPLPTGPVNEQITIRTNDPAHPTLTIQIVGTITAFTGTVHVAPVSVYQPWDEYITIPGPHNTGDTLTYLHTIEEDATRIHPLYVYTQTTETLAGVGEFGVDFAAGQTREWTWEHPYPQGNTLNAIWESSDGYIFAGGSVGTILQFDGNQWVPNNVGVSNSFSGIWGSSKDNVFAVGSSGIIWHYNGHTWTSMNSNTTTSLNGVWGNSDNSIFVVGNDGTILSYNGTNWVSMNSGTTEDLNGVWGSNSANVFAVGDSGVILHYNGASWSAMSSGTTNHLNSLWGVSATDIFAVGGNGTVRRYNGSSWATVTSGTTTTLNSVWGTSSTNVYVVGHTGLIRRYNGSSWTTLSGGTVENIYGIYGINGNDIKLVGNNGVISRYNGTIWTLESSRLTQNQLYSVREVGPNDIFVAGASGTILHFDGTNWGLMSSGTTNHLSSIWGSSSSNVFAVGNSGTIRRYNGSTWSAMTSGTSQNLYGIWGTSGTDIFAVGGSGTIRRYNGSTWSAMTSGVTVTLYGIWGTSSNDIFVVGSSGTILHYNGNTWTTMVSNTNKILTGVWGTSNNDVFAVGYGGTILHYDGNTWETMNSGVTSLDDFQGVGGKSSTDVFAGGDEFLHYDGSTWSPINSIAATVYTSFGNTVNGDLLAAGWEGVILRLEQTPNPGIIRQLAPPNSIEFNLPTTIDNGDTVRYHVQYGLRGEYSSAGGQIYYLTLPKVEYEHLTLDVLLRDASTNPTSVGFDLGVNASIDWSTSFTETLPALHASIDLANSLNTYLATLGVSYGELVTIPIYVTLNTAGDLVLTNLVATPANSLETSAGALSFDTISPTEGNIVEITLPVSNAGPTTLQATTVAFIAEQSDGTELYIGSDFLTDVSVGASASASLLWDTTGFTGDVSIRAVIDPYQRLNDTNTNNNEASNTLHILTRPDLQITNLSATDAFRQAFPNTVNVTLTNLGETNAGQQTVSLYDANPETGGVLIGSQAIAISAGETITIPLAWTPAMLGPLTLFARADSLNNVSETDENNNLLPKTIYVGWGDPVYIDVGNTGDVPYTANTGYGYLTPGTTLSCGSEPYQTYRQANSGTPLQYQFDHLLPGRYYHLDLTFYLCSGTRNVRVLVDGMEVANPVAVSNQPNYLSLLLDPSFYADHQLVVSIEKVSGLGGPVVSEIKLTDIRYCYRDSGVPDEVSFAQALDGCGWVDGYPDQSWGTLPSQSVRFDGPSSVRYQFAQMQPEAEYQLNFNFYEGDNAGRVESILVDGVPLLSGLILSNVAHHVTVEVPPAAFTDGTILVEVLDNSPLAQPVLSEISLEQKTVFSYGITPNAPPIATNDTYATPEDTPLVITVPGVLSNDTDAEANPLIATLQTGVSHGTLTLNPNGSFSYTPAPNFNGTDAFTYLANDGNSNSNLATVTITVNAVNDPPVINPDTASTPEETALTLQVLANDTDVDGDTLTISAVTQPAHGTVVNHGSHVTYTPAQNFSGQDSFTYTAHDGHGGSNSALVTITVNATNDPPVASNDVASTNEDASVQINVLNNDGDPDGDTLVISAVTQPTHGSVVNNGNNVTYTPAPNYNGQDSFTYTVSDGQGGTATATVTVTVNPLNDAPTANDDLGNTNEDTALLLNVLSNDNDVDGDTLTIVSVTQPAHGMVTFTNNNVTYTPTQNYHGQDTFSYTISDGHGGSDTATVTTTINPVNDSPDANDDLAATNENTAVLVNVLENDSDLDGDTLTVTSVTQPAHGNVVNNGTDVTYTPAQNYTGSDSFSYTVSDGHGGTDTASVVVTVGATNAPPVANNDAISTDEDTGLLIDVLENDTDEDNDPLTITSVTQPAHGTVINHGTDVTYTPAANYAGQDTFSYTISDGQGGSDTATVTVTINPVNDFPLANDDLGATSENTSVQLDVLANDSDIDGDPLTISSVTQPTHGSVVNNGNHLTYTPDQNFTGLDTFTYTVDDGHGGTDTAIVEITVGNLNVAPTANDDAAPTDEDTAVLIDVLANDTDADGDMLTVFSVTQPAHGNVTNNGSNVTYTPDPNFYGADPFDYLVSDGHGGLDTGTVTLTINAINDPPIATDDTIVTVEGNAVVIPVLSNDSDVEGDPLLVLSTSDPNDGSAIHNSQVLTYTPDAAFTGLEVFTYLVSDGVLTATATISVTVIPDNGAPYANDDAYAVNEDTPLLVQEIEGVLSNDIDVQGTGLTALLVSSVSHGTLTFNANGSFTYLPAPDFYGTDSFTYKVTDGIAQSNTATVIIHVNNVNDAPVAVDDTYTIVEGTLIVIAPGILANDQDPDNDTLTVILIGDTSFGTLVLNVDGSFLYLPGEAFAGMDSFTYLINDGHGFSNVATVHIEWQEGEELKVYLPLIVR